MEGSELNVLLEPLASSAGACMASIEPGSRAIAVLSQGVAHDRKRLREQLREALTRTLGERSEEASAQAPVRILRLRVDALEKKIECPKVCCA